MKIDVKYGRDSQPVEIPESNFIGTFYPKDVKCSPPGEVIDASIENPLGSETLQEFLEGGEDIVFVVNDGTRPLPLQECWKRWQIKLT